MRDGVMAMADLLGKPRDEVASALGEHWTRRRQNDSGIDLFVSGEPAQVIIVIDEAADTFEVVQPAVVWEGQSPRLAPGKAHFRGYLSSPPPLENVSHAVREAADSRRQSFRWCECCRQIWAAEYIGESGLCHGCAGHTRGEYKRERQGRPRGRGFSSSGAAASTPSQLSRAGLPRIGSRAQSPHR